MPAAPVFLPICTRARLAQTAARRVDHDCASLASRRGGCRRQNGRRLRHPHANSLQIFCPRTRTKQHHPARRRRSRRRHVFHSARQGRTRARAKKSSSSVFASRNLQLLMWREVPVNLDALGEHAFKTRPYIAQALIARGKQIGIGDAFERALYFARKEIERIALQRENLAPVCGVAFRRVRSCTRGCSFRRCSGSSILICAIRCTRPRWRWCINATAPTPFRRGNWRSRFAGCVTTAKSIPCRAILRG